MSLTAGRGPFGSKPTGRFNFDAPEHVVYVEDFPRRVRAVVDGRTVIDSDQVVLVHETGKLPHYAFPADAVEIDADDEPHAEGYVTVPGSRSTRGSRRTSGSRSTLVTRTTESTRSRRPDASA